ncbi:LuxR C-terminal-related transcriptional regulator [Aliidiomarina quisquiliarum]|uniref:LuxR C-terminal-related transcriptional regulator n=1 Tax=Aliidiomarina quisquiliarum TaxID=2938947 RepID=UPI00208E9967|nr:LuxR C-terminal-related transcriptional regulator [Aliidiomarina quisquiliarum]MCO4321339.1 LuxR C-terminal-related transcriptional regulator [Aliidiomarina quisquiliarum]
MFTQRSLQVFDPEDLITKFQPELYESTHISLVDIRRGHSEPNLPLMLVSPKSSPQKVMQLLTSIKKKINPSHIILLSRYTDNSGLCTTIELGIKHCLNLEEPTDKLISQLKQVKAGDIIMCQAALKALMSCLHKDTANKGELLASLTKRERQILILISGGNSNSAIAEELEIAEGTVKVHVKNLLRKLGLKTRLAAASWFYGS